MQAGLDDETDSEFVTRLCKDAIETDQIKVFPERYKLSAALSPHEAARIDGVSIKLDDFNLPVNDENETAAPLIVEGAGGIFVPLNSGEFVLDLMVRLHLPVIIVARTKLGTINHTLLTIKAIRAAGLEIAGVILNGTANAVNKHAIQHYGAVRILCEIPLLEDLNAEQLLKITPALNISDWNI